MTKSRIKITLDLDKSVEKTAKILTNLQGEYRRQVHSDIDKIKKKTKSTVIGHLNKGHGVDKGIYKKSIVINNLENDKDKISYQVGSRKHYRLTHLLEDGHEVWIFIRGKGRPTHRGNIGMNRMQKKSRAIAHIKPGQDYADKAVVDLYESAWNKALEKEK